MSPSGQLKHAQVWKMLNKCAPGWTKIEHTHDYRIDYNGRTMYSFPLGNRKMKRGEVQIHFVRKLARVLDIEDCAKEVLPQLA
jgi:hypothetical protein